MGNQVFQLDQCQRERFRDPNPNPRALLCGGRTCGRPCGLDEREGRFGCDPAGTVFDDTISHLDDLDQLAFKFAGSGNLAALRWLFVYGARTQVCDTNGTTLLHVACRVGSIFIVKDLVRRGLLPDAADSAGWTPLHVASCMGRQDVSWYLLQSGADPQSKNGKGQTPEDLCSSSHTKEVVVSYDTHSRIRPMQRSASMLDGASGNITKVHTNLHFEPFFVPRDPVMQEPLRIQEYQKVGLHLFNASPGHGIAFLVASGVVPDYPVNINRFLLKSGAHAQRYGEFLGAEYSVAQTLCLEFLNSLPLVGTGVISALHVAFESTGVPREWQRADRLVRGISHFWWQQHSEEFEMSKTEGATGIPRNSAASSSSTSKHVADEITGMALHRSLGGPEGLHRVMFSTLMLHQWLQSGHQMTLNEWTQLNTSIDDRGSDIPLHVQTGIYNALAEDRLSLGRKSSKGDAGPGLVPLLEGWAGLKYRGRAQVSHDGMPAACFKQTPRTLAAQGGVSSAGRSAPVPLSPGKNTGNTDISCLDGRALDGPPSWLTNYAGRGSGESVGEAGSGSGVGGEAAGEDRAWLTVHDSIVLLAHAPDAPPYAFVSLSHAALASADGLSGHLSLVGRPHSGMGDAAKEPPKCDESAGWLDLCLLLSDGRYQLLEAPELELRVASTEFDAWMQCICTLCTGYSQSVLV